MFRNHPVYFRPSPKRWTEIRPFSPLILDLLYTCSWTNIINS